MSSKIRARLLASLSSLLIASVLSQPALASSCQWQQLKTPNPGNDVNELNGALAFFVGNVWAVGDSSQAGGSFEDVVEHWDGSTFATTILGMAPVTQLLSVAGQNKSNVWTVGYATSTSDPSTAAPIAFRWDGTAWKTTQPVIMGGWMPARFNAVAGIGTNNAWAVGFRNTTSGPQQLIEHWNGTKWVNFNIPVQQGQQSDLVAISALSHDDIYALGSWQASGQSGTMVEHFDGQTWSTSLSTSDCLSTLTTVAPSDVFAVGACGGSAVIDFFDGSTWSQMPGPAVDPSTIISGISARNIDGILAVGRIPATGEGFSMFFNGTAWTNMPVPNPNGDMRLLNATAHVPQLNEFWTVGTAIPKFGMSRAITVKPLCI